MLDDLRNSASSFVEEEPSPSPETGGGRRKSQRRGTFLGMTAPQRFLITLVLFLMTCVCGIFALLIFEKVVPPIF